MKKKKLDLIKILKAWWPVWLVIVTAFGGLIGGSAHLLAMWNSPNQISETQKAVSELSTSLDTYTAGQEAANKQRDKLLDMLTQQAMNEKRR